MNNVLIYGPPASGKSFIGKKLAEMFNVQFIDLNEEIEARTGDKIEQIISILGEKGFRKVEEDIFNDVVFSNNNAIIALGGGALLSPESRKIAELENVVLCLDWDRKDLEHNFLKDDKDRQWCKDDLEQYRKLLDARRDHYKSFTYQITNAFLDPNVAEENGLSTIFVGKMFSKAIAVLLMALFPKSKFSVVYDQNVKKEADAISKSLEDAGVLSGVKFSVKAIEKNKSMKTVDKIIAQLDDKKVNRNDILISIGGGITSDITGFAASIWKRGIRWISIPTTLLSMVDASVGGKTGVNYNEGKNIIGAFHKPTLVMIDYCFLLSLKSKELKEGYAEAYKHYLLDEDLKSIFESSNMSAVDLLLSLGQMPAFQDYSDWKTIAKFLNTKVKTVKRDPFEKNGLRARLNLGHTVAHALEAYTGYKISHGQAVAIGICEELRIARDNNVLKDDSLLCKVESDLKALGLPTELPKGIKLEDLVSLMHKDKKNTSYSISFILLESQCNTVEFTMM